MANFENVDLFKFWVVFIFPFIAGLICIYSYLDKNIIENYWYLHIYKGILIASLSLILIMFYIFLKTYISIEPSYPRSPTLNKIASIFIVLSIFFLFILVSYELLCFIIWKFEISSGFINWGNIEILWWVSLVTIFFLCILGLILENNRYMQSLSGTNLYIIEFWKIIVILIVAYAACTYIWLEPFSSFSNLPIPGQIIVDQEELNYENNSLIHYSIQIKGPDTGLSIRILKEESNYLYPISIIENIEPQHKTKIISNNDLIVSTLGSGKYSIFINTTEMSAGYYQFKSTVPHYEIICSISDFYIP